MAEKGNKKTRDKGRCANYGDDLTNVATLANPIYDHIIPLSEHGTNDPSNFQLLCQRCNLKKGNKKWIPSKDDLNFW